jgi:hypothetical protein
LEVKIGISACRNANLEVEIATKWRQSDDLGVKIAILACRNPNLEVEIATK